MPNTKLKITTISTLLTILALFINCADNPNQKILTEEQQQQNLQAFEYVWTTVRDKHYDPQFNGVDWQAVHDELLPEMQSAKTVRQARSVLEEMLSRLGLSHFGIIPAELYENIDTPAGKEFSDGETGMDVRVIDGKVLVTAVIKNSPAELAGIRIGWQITQIDEFDTVKLDKIAQEFEGKTYKALLLASVVKRRLMGKIGEKISVECLDGNDEVQKREIVLTERRGQKVKFGNLPPVYVWIETKKVGENIGYIAFNAFLNPNQVMGAFNSAMASFMGADGVIIDLRGNGGGMGAMAMGMAGWLIAEKNLYLGTLYTRDNELKLIVLPRPETYTGPVAVLVDGLSGSSSEFFAGGLKDLGRAKIIGSRTCGAALPSAIEKLTNGDGFQYAFGNYISRSGQVLEGEGVFPDIEVQHTQAALLEGRDLMLAAAIEWIGDSRKK